MTKLKLLMTKLNCKETSSKKQEDRFMNKTDFYKEWDRIQKDDKGIAYSK